MANQGKINLSSENYAGVHPDIMDALAKANTGSAPSYGNDGYTKETVALFKQHFGDDIDVYFAFNGTGANNFGIGSVTEKFSSIFCTDVAHLMVDESTAPETFIGCRMYPVNQTDGKIVLSDLKSKIKRFGDVHHPQPKLISLTQPTEYGTVYTLDELKAIKQVCTDNGMLLHVDGARFFNAAAYLNATLKQISADAGVDILTLGGTKSGLMFGEAVIFFNTDKPGSHKYNLKRSMQLASKNRFIAVQFDALLRGGLWKEIAEHSNNLALKLKMLLSQIPSLEFTQPVETNAVFVKLPASIYDKTQEFSSFYEWNEEKSEYRFMISFNTTEEEIKTFVDKLRGLID
jgi:threonine aldolase